MACKLEKEKPKHERSYPLLHGAETGEIPQRAGSEQKDRYVEREEKAQRVESETRTDQHVQREMKGQLDERQTEKHHNFEDEKKVR
jgi:hypothetical protein